MGDPDRRFSDIKLLELRNDFDQHRKEQDERFDQLAGMVEESVEATRLNTVAIQDLAEALRVQADSTAEALRAQADGTAGVVRAYEELRAGGRWLSRIKTGLAWLSALGVAGSFIAACLAFVVRQLGYPV